MQRRYDEYIKIIKPLGGRKFTIGTLYNFVEDIIIPIRLWDREEVSRLVATSSKTKMTVKIHTMSVEQKDSEEDDGQERRGPLLFDLGMDEHSAMSFIANMSTPDYKGAWKYAVDRANSVANSYQVAVHCRRSSRIVSLNPDSQPEVICQTDKLSNATHVVVAIGYGLEAFCLFSNPQKAMTCDDAESSSKILNYARYFADSLSDGQNRLETEKEDGRHCLVPSDLNCVLYSDLIETKSGESWTLKPISEQYEACKKVLNQSTNKAIPLKIWLCPLSKLKPSIVGISPMLDSLLLDVSREVVIRCQLMRDRLQNIRSKTNSLMAQFEKLFQPCDLSARKRTQNFDKTLVKFLTILTKALRDLTISIRRNAGVSEITLTAMISAVQTKSPFVPRKLIQWICRQRQLMDFWRETIQLPGLHFVSDEEQLKKEINKGIVVGSNAVVLHLPSNIAAKSQYVIDKMNRYADQFDSSDPSSWTREKQGEKVAVTLTKIHQLSNVRHEFSNWVTNHNRDMDNVRYILFYDEQHICTTENLKPSIRLYECGSGEKSFTNFSIPNAPGQITVKENHRGAITLTWTWDEKTSRDSGNSFLVQHCSVNKSESKWTKHESDSNMITINHLQSGEDYLFRVAAVTKGGKSPFGPTSRKVTIDPVFLPPADIKCESVTDTAITISWNHGGWSVETVTVTSFSIDCWIDGHQQESFIQRWAKEKTLTLEPLISDTLYCIQIRAVCDNSTNLKLYGPAGFLRVRTLHPERAAHIVRQISIPLTNGLTGLAVYKLPLLKEQNSSGIGHYAFGKPSFSALFGKRRQRTILLLGATGSGKTTLINAMVNYFLGVQWEDEFRFKLIDEPAGKSQAYSQTESITTYDLYHTKGSNVEFSLTVLDTPGFGDTSGMEKDKLIMQQIEKYFHCPEGIRQLEAVCFVVQSSQARLTEEQKYIFNSILSIFGQDIKDNIRLMVTFGDTTEPPVLAVVEKAEVPFSIDPVTNLPLYYKFNSPFFFDGQRNENNRMYFDMTVSGFKQFFTDLSHMKTKSLVLTREVLEERKQLEALVGDLEMKTERKFVRMQQLEQNKKKLHENQELMYANKDSDEIETVHSVDICGTGQFTTNCQECKKTCHFPCSQASDGDKKKCSMMDPDGRCMICKCPWTDHFNQKYRYEMVESDTIRQQRSKIANEMFSNKQSLEEIQEEMDQNEKEVQDLVQEILLHLQRLNKIALLPHHISNLEYFDVMIENAKGNPEKKKKLEELREKADRQAKLIDSIIPLSVEKSDIL